LASIRVAHAHTLIYRTVQLYSVRNMYVYFYFSVLKADLHVQDKIIILGSSFLIDYNYFERQQRTCCWWNVYKIEIYIQLLTQTTLYLKVITVPISYLSSDK
jgi:hypothetical protein